MKSSLNRPYIIINAAMSVDGKIALTTRRQTRLSCDEDLLRVHRIRAEVDAILIGIGTVLSDDPKLTVKFYNVERQPIRVVLDSKLRIPDNVEVLKPYSRTIIATTEQAPQRKFPEHVEIVRCGKDRVDIRTLMELLYVKGIRRILVEGGGTVINSFIREKLVDELNVYVSPVIIGGSAPSLCEGPGASNYDEMIKLKLVGWERIGEGILLKFVLSNETNI